MNMKKKCKKNRNKILALLISCILTISSMTFSSVYAEEEIDVSEAFELELFQDGKFPTLSEEMSEINKSCAYQRNVRSNAADSAEQAIYDGLYQCQTAIDISSYQITPEQCRTYVQDILNTSPELFYVSTCSYSISGQTGLVTRLTPNYAVSGNELEKQRAFYNDEMNKILAHVDLSWSDLEKIVYIHDYLAQNYEYDSSLQIHDAYQFLEQQKGVCQSYTLVFLGLMQALGIETSVAVSASMNHIWNVVNLNGNWYHLDVTWDDPVNDRFGLAGHNYLLVSDTAFQTIRGGSSQTHHDWVCNYTCSDTAYDNYFWMNSSSPFQYLNKQWYYCAFDSTSKQGHLYSLQNLTANNPTIVYSLGRWLIDGSSSFYTSCYSGLNVYNNKLYFNTYTDIYSYDPSTQNTASVLTPTQSGHLYGMRINNSTLHYLMASAPSNSGNLYTHTLDAAIPATEKPIVTVKPVPTATTAPTTKPTSVPTVRPTVAPTSAPTVRPTVAPTSMPTVRPTVAPTSAPTVKPSLAPTSMPTVKPTVAPTSAPTVRPTVAPTSMPTVGPTVVPTSAPTVRPTVAPTSMPTVGPTVVPTSAPTLKPTLAPTIKPTSAPNAKPTETAAAASTTPPNNAPSTQPTLVPTSAPTASETPVNNYPLGDMNKDGILSLNDVQIVLETALGIRALPEDTFSLADANADGEVNLNDALLLLEVALGIKTLHVSALTAAYCQAILLL